MSPPPPFPLRPPSLSPHTHTHFPVQLLKQQGPGGEDKAPWSQDCSPGLLDASWTHSRGGGSTQSKTPASTQWVPERTSPVPRTDNGWRCAADSATETPNHLSKHHPSCHVSTFWFLLSVEWFGFGRKYIGWKCARFVMWKCRWWHQVGTIRERCTARVFSSQQG